MRFSLLEPIPELNLAATLLDAAADAVLQLRLDLAAKLLELSDFQAIREYTWSLVGKHTVDVHGLVHRPKCLPKGERDPLRMPRQSQERAIFSRDGWRCRFCGVKVIDRCSRSVLIRMFEMESHWGKKEHQRHSALYALAASLDHIVPHARGGKNEPQNFVTACYGCQFGRGNWLLEEVKIQDPRLRQPIRDIWDGLSRLVDTQQPIPRE